MFINISTLLYLFTYAKHRERDSRNFLGSNLFSLT